jgi:hypothetical protein
MAAFVPGIDKYERALSTFPYIPFIDDRLVNRFKVFEALSEAAMDRSLRNAVSASRYRERYSSPNVVLPAPFGPAMITTVGNR